MSKLFQFVVALLVLLSTIVVVLILVLLLVQWRLDLSRRTIGRLEPSTHHEVVTPRVTCMEIDRGKFSPAPVSVLVVVNGGVQRVSTVDAFTVCEHPFINVTPIHRSDSAQS